MTGWKTKVAGLAAICTGLGLVGSGLAAGDAERIVAGLITALGGLSVLGLGHKVDKLIDVLKNLKR
jgi:hypothetical protein